MHFRVYRLNQAGRIVSGDWIEAETEQQAFTRAQSLCEDETPTVEVWQGVHRLATLPCGGERAA